MNGRVLVTGAAGFLGSHLVDELLRLGHSVIMVDNFCTGQRANLAHLAGNQRAQLLEVDVTALNANHDTIRKAFSGIEAVYHLASPASPVQYRRLSIETLMTNAEGTRRALEIARVNGARFLLASTSEVYGDPAEHPQAESYAGHVDPVGPRACYDEGKRFAEALTMEYVRRYGLDARIVRIFNTYGPRMGAGDGRLVPSFVIAALRGQPFRVFGDGRQTRCLCYVSDLIRGLVLAATVDGLRGEVINLGNDGEMTVLEIADLVARLVGVPARIEFLPAMDGDPRRRKPALHKSKELLGWEPRVAVEEGLRATIEYFCHPQGMDGQRLRFEG